MTKDQKPIDAVLADLVNDLRVEAEVSGRFENALQGYSQGWAKQRDMSIDDARADLTQAYHVLFEEGVGDTAARVREDQPYGDYFSEERAVDDYESEAVNICDLSERSAREGEAYDRAAAGLSPREKALLDGYLNSGPSAPVQDRDADRSPDEDRER
ncbi:MAG: hypothetical protein AAGB16_00980 [Pseudomonadota bacterium]